MDPVLLWNGVALEANRVSHSVEPKEQPGPTLSSRALAIVHLAIYEAFARVVDNKNKLPFYLDQGALPTPPQKASAGPAIATAAHKTLSELFPSQRPYFDSVLAGAGDESDPGHEFGKKVGQAILDDRSGDPGAGADGYKSKKQRGKHRPDPDNPTQGFHAPFYGAKSKGFGITARHELAPPPLDDPQNEYIKALREVRGKGIAPELVGTLPKTIDARTINETVVGLFWAYDGAAGLGTPPRLYNQIIRLVADAKDNTVAENARLFAFVNVAMADAGILAWDQKYIHEFWRPVVGIREQDKSMGPEPIQASNNISDDCDSSWLPLGAPNTNRIGKNATPPFPAYPSGHATFGAAAFHITRLFYGVKAGDQQPDQLFDKLSFVSDELNGLNTDNKGTVRARHARSFPGGLWQMIEENGRSRVDLGVHWVFDAFAVNNNGAPNLAKKVNGKSVGGVPLGLQIAEDIFEAGDGKAPKKSKVKPRP